MNTPQLIQHRDVNVKMIKQSEENFLVVDSLGIIVYSYEGRVLSQSKFNFSLAAVQSSQIAMNDAQWLLVDPRDQKHIIGYESQTGRSLASSAKPSDSAPILTHKDHIKQVSIQPKSKIYAYLDQQKEVYLTEISQAKAWVDSGKLDLFGYSELFRYDLYRTLRQFNFQVHCRSCVFCVILSFK